MAVLSEGAGGPKRREAALDEQKPFNLGRQGKNTKCSDWRRKVKLKNKARSRGGLRSRTVDGFNGSETTHVEHWERMQ